MWPTISNISGNIANTIKSYANDNLAASGLNAWVRVYSGAVSDKGAGLILESNTNFKIFSAAGENVGSIYGNAERSGVVGRTWNNTAVVSDVGRVLRPSPIITTLSSKEGQDQISRTCNFTITCFSLEQLELVQTYFMEPGYSVGVEWGWNTANSAKGLINTGAGQEGILNQIADVTLNNKELSAKRIFTNGEYDIFLGFIIGSTVSSDGENFKIEVRLRGAPSLPTYLQSQNRITVKSSGVEPDPDKSKALFPENELTSDGDTEEEAKKRRFKYMFNELPAFRQTESVKKLINKAKAIDFINFDRVVQAKIDEFLAGAKTPTSPDGNPAIDGEETVRFNVKDVGQIDVPKEKVFSTNRYIRFGLAIDILNEVGTVDKYEVGGKSISFKINIDTSIIGAFPYMFSTKKSKLIIPGVVPNARSTYFLSSEEIEQKPDGRLNNINVVKALNFTEFVERGIDLNQFGLKEKKEYYGYLKNLYVNFDMFKEKLEQKNKNIREILEDILNEMSSAVNSFWNFQIIEGEYKISNEEVAANIQRNAPGIAARTTTTEQLPETFQEYNAQNNILLGGRWNRTSTTNTETTPTGGGTNTTETTTFNSVSTENDIVITVVDENWIGENPDPGGIKTFKHSGIGSPFLDATLDISIPAEVGAKIINERIGANSQTDIRSLKVDTTTLFSSETDLFLKKVQPPVSGAADDTNQDLNEAEDINNISRKIAEQEALIDRINGVSRLVDEQSSGRKETLNIYKDKNGNVIKTILVVERAGSASSGVDGKEEITVTYTNLPNVSSAKILEAQNTAQQAKVDRVTTNLEKIDVVPKPTIYKLPNIPNDAKLGVDAYFFVYCLDDTDFFESMRNYYFQKKGSGALSQPLPIKYSFTILGNSGIRRGDTFKIDGIPRKYAEKGLFQVQAVEHSLSGMTWETTIEALYRQIE